MVFMGTPQFAVASLEKVVQAGHQVVGVVTQPDRPKGRGKKLAPSPVKNRAMELGLDIYQPERVKEAQFVQVLKRLNPEVIVVVAYGQILSKEILNLPPLGCINVHASLLPKYRGAAPIHWAIINGETETGITTMLMDQGMDTGDMLLKAKVEIGQDTTTGELHDLLADLGGQVLLETLVKIANGEIKPEPQNNDQASYAPLLKKEHEKIEWNDSAKNIHNLVRGMNPWPGAYTFLRDTRIKIWQTLLKEIKTLQDGRPGEILEISEDGIWVQTGNKPLLVSKLQPAGKNVMSARDFFNGYGISIGQFLGEDHE
ncbi:MAG: methionyl-tRNA formyltransferase [Clostridia bacterium]|jgi:methionyl-tRNA formyltransferase|nr:methionyl-tRNA formyltransferase [Clostridia bacterium]MDN5322254.1 methionyl-tRNA formyltransferase [Clostridia bacterium]